MRNLRTLTAAITILAWFLISNHCILVNGLAASAPASVTAPDDCCPMHASKTTAPAQPKKQNDAQVCCKNLPATALKGSQPLASFVGPLLTILFDRHDLLQGARDELPALCLDTGPPNALSFSELVLQRSLRVHAPPSIA